MKSGVLVNNLSGDMSYKSFKPNDLPIIPPIELDNDTLEKLVEASKSLGRLEASVSLIPNVNIFVSSYIRKEALISSQIEGTQCTLDDILNPNVDIASNLEVNDVINYINACNYGIDRLNTLPLCNRFLKELHKLLMKGVRGNDKNPGGFRKSQNWIGPKDCGLKNAKYIPPNVEDMKEAMNNLESYLNSEDDVDPLVKIALVHYQFETIHPFLDGNGRVGRLLITLFLLERKIISKPIIYISYYLKKNQTEYYDRISLVREKGDYVQWINFFLESVNRAAIDSFNTIVELKIINMYATECIKGIKHRGDNIERLYLYIEEHPIINIRDTAKALNLSINSITNLVNKLVELNILKETSSTKRKKIFAYERYLEILRKDTELL